MLNPARERLQPMAARPQPIPGRLSRTTTVSHFRQAFTGITERLEVDSALVHQ